MESGIGYPWYGLTVGDNSKVYSDFGRLTGTVVVYVQRENSLGPIGMQQHTA